MLLDNVNSSRFCICQSAAQYLLPAVAIIRVPVACFFFGLANQCSVFIKAARLYAVGMAISLFLCADQVTALLCVAILCVRMYRLHRSVAARIMSVGLDFRQRTP